MKAINNFDDAYNVQFSTYAVPIIMGEIKRYFRDDGTIKVSRSLKELNIKVTKAKSKEKIDGIVASIMAIDRAERNQGDSRSVYDERGILIF